MLLFLTTANEAIMSLPVVVVLQHRMHRTLSAGPQERNWGGHSLERSAAPRVRCRHEEQLSRQMLRSEGIGFVQRLPSQHEGDRIVVRRFHPIVYLARASLYRSANECPIDLASWLKQTTRRRCRCARSGDRILKSR